MGDHNWDFAEFATPTQRAELWMVGRKGAFGKAIQDESVLDGEVQVILQGTMTSKVVVWVDCGVPVPWIGMV
jgi:hypothetical protein